MAGGSFGGGVGTTSNPFLVEDDEDLKAINNNMSASYELTNDIYSKSIDGWLPIGFLSTNGYTVEHEEFTGTLDGKGFSIIGLNFMQFAKTGLFVSLNGAKIFDVSLKNAVYENTGRDAMVGMFCSSSMNTEFTNCHVLNPEFKTDYINGKYIHTVIRFGFLVQYAFSSDFTNCKIVRPTVSLNHNESSHSISFFADTLEESRVMNCHVEGGEYNFNVLGDSVRNSDYYITFSGFTNFLFGTETDGPKISRCSANYIVNQHPDSNEYHLTIFHGFVGSMMDYCEIKDSFVQADFNLTNISSNSSKIYEFASTGFGARLQKIKNCYSVVRNNAEFLGVTSYSFADYESGNIVSCYNNEDTFILSGPSDVNRYPQGNRTTEQMKTKENYVGWDFENVWIIREGESYPVFRPLPTKSETKCERINISKLLGGY